MNKSGVFAYTGHQSRQTFSNSITVSQVLWLFACIEAKLIFNYSLLLHILISIAIRNS